MNHPAVLKLLFLMVALALLYSCGKDTPKLPKLSEDAVILAFGNSLTYGTGAERNESYPAILENLSGKRIVNAGIPGELSAKGLQRLSEVLNEHKPELLLLCHGGNDLLRRYELAKTAINLKKIRHHTSKQRRLSSDGRGGLQVVEGSRRLIKRKAL
jgi:acyl-CoA thioesterase-1